MGLISASKALPFLAVLCGLCVAVVLHCCYFYFVAPNVDSRKSNLYSYLYTTLACCLYQLLYMV
jgi:hypothetical protein